MTAFRSYLMFVHGSSFGVLEKWKVGYIEGNFLRETVFARREIFDLSCMGVVFTNCEFTCCISKKRFSDVSRLSLCPININGIFFEQVYSFDISGYRLLNIEDLYVVKVWQFFVPCCKPCCLKLQFLIQTYIKNTRIHHIWNYSIIR